MSMLKELDEEVNDLLPDGTFSDYGGQEEETISSAMGKAQARILWGRKQAGQEKDLSYPFIPLHNPLGQLAEDICEAFQPYHGLRSIEWDHGIDMEKLYAGIHEVVYNYLAAKGIVA